MYQSNSTLIFPQTLVLRYTRLEPEDRRQPRVAADYAKWFLGRTKGIDLLLADGRSHLVAGRFTGADICVGYAFQLAETLDLIEGVSSAIRRWWEGLKARPAFRAARARQNGAS
ncbi:hypothetical protein [Thermaurantiacus sp.]